MLPSKLLRFSDLHCVGIRNWPTLKRRVERDGFPAGRYLGSSRVWTVEEVEQWFDSKGPPENVKPGPSVAAEGTGQTKSNDKSRHTESATLNQAAGRSA